MEESDLIFLNTFANEVISSVDVLRSCVMFGVLSEGFGALVVDVERYRSVRT
jgi:hypothetical protein